MREKLIKDFQGSCLHDIELLEEAIEECDSRMRLIASHRHLQLDDRLRTSGVQVPRRSTASGPWPAPDEPDAAARVESSGAGPVRQTAPRSWSTSAPYAPACIAVLAEPPPPVRARCARRLPGPDGATADPSAAPRRRGRFPARAARPVPAGWRSSRALLSLDDAGARVRAGRACERPARRGGAGTSFWSTKDGSPEEQVMARAGIPASADPEIVVSLERTPRDGTGRSIPATW